MKHEDLKPGLVFGFDDVVSVEPYLILRQIGRRRLVCWWHGNDAPYNGVTWEPGEVSLERMTIRPHSPETLIRWIQHLKETTDAHP